ncbi:MFS transporter [Amycolatopsis albispora]|uniref:Puromycin resistance protein pur8 n=1 Tax=Amycolatopsis albispora TaxID=1804986 RepID=A0A344L3D6_9PSEU|nr:MFS transporter [Amycolatopsis albispora]AXB42560.1 Puromycin resistance protein pur8 [Amycolatopsis albispora]
MTTTSARTTRWPGFALLCTAQLMVLLDTTIVNIALPPAQHDLGLSDADRHWIVTAYLLAFGALLLPAGRISDAVGRRRALLIGVLGFGLASAAGGAAADGAQLIAARAAQGAFAALLAPTAMALLTALFTEPAERGRALGRFSAVVGAGGAAGLLAGGLLTATLDWRWCLYVNVPIAALTAVLTPVLLPETPRHPLHLDLLSTLLGVTGAAALVYATTGRPLWLVPAAVLLGAFALRQVKAARPLLPPHLLATRRRLGALTAVATTMAAMFGTMLVLTYQLQEVLGFDPLRTGLAILPGTAATMLIASQVSGRLMARLSPRRLIVPGMLLTAAGLGLLTQLTPDSTYLGGMLPAQLVFGAGTGLVMSPSISAALTGAAPRDAGLVSALVSTAQQLGGSIGISVLNAVAAGGATLAAQVHGHTVAAAVAAGLMLAGALASGLLLGR